MCRFKTFLILIVIQGRDCLLDEHFLESDEQSVPNFFAPMFLSTSLLITSIILSILINYKIPIPYNVFVMILGALWGFGCVYDPKMASYSGVLDAPPLDLLFTYLPITMFKVSFSIDIHTFIKSLPQILIISIPVALLTGCTIGIMMQLIIDSTWPLLFGILFGMLCTATFPPDVVRLLKEIAVHTKHTSILLEGEALIGVVTVDIVVNVIMGHLAGSVVEWYQFLAIVLRFIIFGLLVGYIMGAIGRFLMRKMYNDSLGLVAITFGLPFFTFTTSEVYFSGCGAISVIVLGIMMGMERTALSTRIDSLLINFWKVLALMVNTFVCLVAAVLSVKLMATKMDWRDYVLVLVTFLVTNIVRLLCFFLFSPILSRIGYGLTIRNMLVCVWGGIKAPFSIILVTITVAAVQLPPHIAHLFFIHIVLLYFLSIFINASCTPLLLNVMGMTKISMARQVNMNNCIKHILVNREKAIATLKMDRFLADANWSMVNIATTTKHPYKVNANAADQDDDFFMGYRFTFCPDCKKEIVDEPTPKELKEMTKEAKMRILKAKKISYSRQYENGMVSKNGIRILIQAVDIAMDTEEAVIVLDELYRRFQQESYFRRFIRNRVKNLSTKSENFLRPPRTYWRRVCYHLVMRRGFFIFFNVASALNISRVIFELIFNPPWKLTLEYRNEINDFLVVLDTLFSLIFITQFIIKIMAYSWIHIYRHGFETYFRSCWDTIEFIALCGITTDTVLTYLDIFYTNVETIDSMLIYFVIAVKVVRMFRLLKILFFCKIWYPRVIRYLDSGVDSNMALTYELGKGYVTGEEEVLEMLPHMVDNEKVKNELKVKIEHDRLAIIKQLGLVQKDSPWIAITVKSKQAINTILNSMKDAVHQLRVSGWVDDFEQAKLKRAMNDLYKYVNSIKSVRPSAPKVIFKEVSWMAGEEEIIDFLFENVTVKKFEPGEPVCEEGKVAEGIYIVVTGLLMLSYIPEKSVLDSLHEYGQLPIVDYISSTKYHESIHDYIVSGNCVGELSTLTERAYNCKITADTHSQVYVLSHGVIKRAMELNPDPINGLESRIWKGVSIRIAIPLLMSIPAYQAYDQDQIKYALERAFMPDLSNYKIFVVTDMMQDVILIEGVAADFNTRELYIAPCYIPRTVQKIILPTSSMMNIPIDIEVKLLIIPEKDVDEYEVMMNQEEICELVDAGSTTCLQHMTQNRSSRMRRRIRKDLLKPSVRKHYSGSISDKSSRASGAVESTVSYFKNATSDIQSVRLDMDEEEQRSHSYSPAVSEKSDDKFDEKSV